jgi:hypothetical protein
MKKLLFAFLFNSLVLLTHTLECNEPITYSLIPEGHAEALYQKPSAISDATWREVLPYLMPADHPAKPFLDAVTSQYRITAGLPTLEKAGFKPLNPHSRKKMIVASHPDLQGYLIKAYMDVHNLFKQEGLLWKRRVEGARLIQSTIDKHGYNHLFKVPKKWIYPLCLQPPAVKDPAVFPKHFILIVEDMNIYNRIENREKYRNLQNKEILEALYTVVTEDRLFDSLFLDNIPFCKDGLIAFLDTEYFNAEKKKIKYKKLHPFLSRPMKKYWKTLSK